MDAYEKYKFTKPQSNTLVFQDWDEENQYTWQASSTSKYFDDAFQSILAAA